jgi:hypothetical protein
MKWPLPLSASLVATFISLLIPFAFGTFVPIQVPADQVPASPAETGKRHSLEDLDRATRLMKEKTKATGDPEAWNRYTYALREKFWLATWIPWLVLPFVVRVRGYPALYLSLPPLVFAVLGAMLPLELAAFAIAYGLGLLIAHCFARSRPPAPTDRAAE